MNIRRALGSNSRADQWTGPTIAECVEHVLRSRGLTLAEVSRQTAVRYERLPHYFIPHNFYYDLCLPGYSPKIEQVLALSRISNYRVVDWLTILGFDLAAIPRLQLEFPVARTSLIDSTLYDPNAWIDWFEDTTSKEIQSLVLPLGQLLISSLPRRAVDFSNPIPSPFCYAKIGCEDALAFPDLLPGSVVRADTRVDRIRKAGSERLFFVEHAGGIVCCQLRARAGGKVALWSEALPFTPTELKLGSELRVLGVLDAEIRPSRTREPTLSTSPMRFLEPKGLPSPALGRRLGALLERARSHAGLSFRLASAKSGWVAETLGDPRYFCAPGSLAEYEAKSRLPAHIHKIFSLCVLYSLRFSDVLRAAGIETLDASHDPIPDALVGRARPEVLKSAESPPTQGLLHSLVREFEEIPLFLHQSLSVLAGLPGLSMRDLFWARTGRLSRHPLLKDAVFVSVNRRLKKPTVWRHKPLYEQPLYVLLLRDGSYQLAACDLEGSILVVHSFANGSPSPQRLRNGVDVEVIGKITAILRRLQ